ncbi:hypothetical protein [Bremerella cremea]|uniref:hypothetical protein n=1 Tax=Bremerella cremea TaxID=1031537 RepID=UPI0031E53A86
MEFFDASTLTPEERHWEKPVEPITLPSPSLFLVVMSILMIAGSLILSTISIVEFLLYPSRRFLFLAMLSVSWFGSLVLLQYIGVFLRSWVASAIALAMLGLLMLVGLNLGLFTLVWSSTQTWRTAPIFVLVIPLALLCLVQLDWTRSLRKCYQLGAKAELNHQFSAWHLLIFVLLVALQIGFATHYHKARVKAIRASIPLPPSNYLLP